MSAKINLIIEVANKRLKREIEEKLASDWTASWKIIPASHGNGSEIAVTDSVSKLPEKCSGKYVILSGKPKKSDKVFASSESKSSDEIIELIRQAIAYKDITEQNLISKYGQYEDDKDLEVLTQSLSAHIDQLVKQSQMRIAIVEQFPAGMIGIDDENVVVMANPSAVRMLGLEDMPIWGMEAAALLGSELAAFLKQDKKEQIKIKKGSRNLLFRKTPFMLDKKQAGTILAVWEN